MFDTSRARLRAAKAAAYAPLLEQGERLLATGMVAGAFIGRDDIETDDSIEFLRRVDAAVSGAVARLDKLPPLPKGFVLAAGMILDPSIPTPDPDVLLGGHIGHGDADSIAALFKSALRGAQPDLFVTDRRVGLAVDTDDKVAVDDVAVPVATKRATVVVPRMVLHAVRRRRRPLEWGRLELAFTDGSQITLTAGMIVPTRANRLYRALTSPPS